MHFGRFLFIERFSFLSLPVSCFSQKRKSAAGPDFSVDMLYFPNQAISLLQLSIFTLQHIASLPIAEK